MKFKAFLLDQGLTLFISAASFSSQPNVIRQIPELFLGVLFSTTAAAGIIEASVLRLRREDLQALLPSGRYLVGMLSNLT